MTKYLFVLGVALMLLWGTACKDKQPPAPARNDAETDKKAEDKQKPNPGVWPPLQENQQVDIAQDLTAKNYYVILDCSGSMADTGCSKGLPKLNAAKKSLAKFVSLVPDDANLALLVFQNSAIQELIPLGRQNRNQFINAVNATRSSGGTPLLSAIKKGYHQIEEQGRKQLGYGQYTLVIVTDGEASSGEDPTRIVQWILDYSPIQIHTIGFCIGTNHSLNIPGRTVYKAADNPQQLEKGLQDVLAESEQFDISEFN